MKAQWCAIALFLQCCFVSVAAAHLGQEHPEFGHDYFPDFEIGDFSLTLEVSACLHAARDLEEIPDGSGRFFSARSFNRLYMISPNQEVRYFHQLPPSDTSETEGFGALAIHPQFAIPDSPGYGKLYGVVVDKEASAPPDFNSGSTDTYAHSVLTEIKLDDPSSNRFAGSVRELMRFNQGSRFHNVNDIDFGPDGQLYIAVGEDTVRDNSQALSSVYGKILRIDPLGSNSANGKYGIPPDNPFLDDPSAAPEVYAYGVRNPWRMNFDSLTGDLYTGDVGLNSIEEIDLIEKGQNYGWPVKEGSFLTDREAIPDEPDPITGLTVGEEHGFVEPLFQYDQTDGDAVIGGTVYRGSDIPELYGMYVFGDWSSRSLFYGDPATGEMGFLMDPAQVDAFFDAWDPKASYVSIEVDLAGELHIVGSNCIVRLAAAETIDCDFDDDGDCDLADLNMLQYLGLGGTDSIYDLDGSGGSIDSADTAAWLNQNGTTPGDADLDGDVDANDLNALGQNWLADNVTSWANGDFNGSMTVDQTDLNLIGLNWRSDAVATPEPANVWMPVVMLVISVVRKRSNRHPEQSRKVATKSGLVGEPRISYGRARR